MSDKTPLKLSQTAQIHQHCLLCDELRGMIRENCRQQPSGLIKCLSAKSKEIIYNDIGGLETFELPTYCSRRQ